jgi:hypothetical protein
MRNTFTFFNTRLPFFTLLPTLAAAGLPVFSHNLNRMKKGLPSGSLILPRLFARPLFIAAFLLAAGSVFGQTGASSQAFWQQIKDSDVAAESAARLIVPSQYRVLRLDLTAMKTALLTAPVENNAVTYTNGIELHFPMPDGTFGRFKVWYSPIMAPDLAAKYPEIRTYAGFNIDNPANIIRLDVTPAGFHAMTYGNDASLFIDPYAKGNTKDYLCYYKRNFVKKDSDKITCLVENNITIDLNDKDKAGGQEFVGDCGIRHEYRLAVAATGEYSVFHGGTVALAMAAINTTMNRVNGVFEKDASVRMILIGNNDLIVYLNAGTDPYTNGDPGLMIDENQTNTDAVIGNANYDIGHVFGTNSGGLAGLGVVCSNANKARGVTGSGAPIGDPFDIDYVAHEMGHQFKGNHTQYNDGCNRNNATAIEPGSASTIMGYAGICAPDIQANSDAYFSTASLFEMRPFVATGGGSTCDNEISVANVSPTVTALVNYSIPISTPFVQTASATDPNGSLTYCWEQIDAYTAPTQTMPPAATNLHGPVFRSLNPTTSPSRYFPNLPNLFNNVTPTWEVLPSVGRAMNFRVTVRDNVATAGCTGEASNTVTTVAAAGPFVVTSPNTAVSYPVGSTQTVTWNVANTTAAPVSCANVDILFTSDGGANFTTLLANTPNDGTQAVTMPNTATNTARIVVRCANNIFFDVSNVNFKLVGPLVINEVDYDQPGADAAEFIELKNISANAVNLNGWTVELVNGANGGAVIYTTINLPNVNLAAGAYFVICANNANTPNCDLDVAPNADLIQNGAPDGIGLRNAGVLVDAVSYEGNTGAPYTETSGVGLIDGAGAANQGISRFPDGVDTDVNNVDLLSNVCVSPGLTNLNTAANCVLPCDITAITFTNVGSCNDNGTPSNSADDYFTATITVTYVNPPANGNLNLTGDVLAGGGALSVAAPFTSPSVFNGVRLKADGTPSVVTATFSADPLCNFTVSNGPTVNSCSNPCNISGVTFSNTSQCNDNGTNSDPADDYFTADITVTFTFPPGSGNLTLTGDVLAGGGVLSVAAPFTSPVVFSGVRLKADGTASAVTATFSADPACNFTENNGPTVASCSNAMCSLTSAGLTDVHCEDNNESGDDPNDDYIWFQLNPTGSTLGNGYNVTVSSGSVLWNGSVPAVNVPYGSSQFFRLQEGSAGGGNVTITITDSNDQNCTISVLVIDPGSCSLPECSLIVVCPPSPSGTFDCNNPIPAPVTTEADFEALGGDISGVYCGTLTITSVTGTVDNCTSSSITRTYTIFDDRAPENGVLDENESSETCTITFSYAPDQTPPMVTPGSIAACYPSVAAAEAAALAVTTATDNCTGMVTQTAVTLGTCAAVITVTATDLCNNSASVSYNTRIDGTPPTLNGLPATPVTVNCNDPLPAVPNVTATDNCGPVTPVFNTTTTPGNCPQAKTITRTWTATDACGNVTSFTQIINVVDVTAPVFNQNPLPANITVSCSNIPMPAVLDGTDNCDPGIPPPVIFINEIHYDNTGADVNEFIEIAGTAGINLANYQIVLYNGTGGAPYSTTVLSGLIDNEAGGFGAVSFAYPVNGIQNGAPDAIALATTSGIVLQFLSYEGAFVAVGGVANGMMSTDIGVLELGTEPVGLSLQLTGAGQQYGDFTWVGPIAASAGTLNAGQTITPLPGVIPAIFSQMIVAGDCNGESTITRMWQLKDACNNSITHTQILTVTDTEGPAFSPPPLPMDITLSCEQPVPPAPVLTAADLCDVPGMQMERVWINEIHYDNTGGDVGEFIEIAGTAGTDLSTYSLVLYNGTGGASYNTLALGGVIPNLANGFGTLCFGYPVNGIQNGAPDGVALVHDVMGGMVVQFLSYEGVFAATNGPANGMNSTNIGVSETGTEPVGQSLYLTGNGDDYSDFTWTGPLAASNCGVNTGQTFIAMSMGPVVTFEESETPGTCPQERMIFRTWTATDNCGNETVLNQTIDIVDNTPPTVNCPANLTLNLDIFGNASLNINNINYSFSDNCAPNSSLLVTPFPPQTFTCADEGLTRTLTISVQDPCGNTGSCTFNVTIAPFSRCTPVILITDPCVCKNNATSLENGQFGETIKIESLAGKTWTIIANTGLYAANSPAPPSAPVLIPVGTIFVENPFPSGDYYLTGVHVDAQGYSITVRSETGQILTIGNACQYPNPEITADLSGPFCLFSDPVNLTGIPGDANIVSQGFTVNGVPSTVFDPSQGVGQYFIVYTVNGGVPKAFGPNDPGCIQTVSLFVNVLPTPANLSCNNLVTIGLDNLDCSENILPDMILDGSYNCYDDYIVEIDRTLPFGNGPWQPGFVDVNDIGKTYQVRVTHLVSGNKCWGNLKIEDKLAPEIKCENFSIPCNTPDLSANYLFNTLGILAATPVATDCQNFMLSYLDTQTPQSCASGLSKIVSRKWTAKDASGNTSTCEQTIGLIRPTLADVTMPPDYDGFDAPGFNCTASYPSPDWIETQGLQGYPHVFGQPSGCSINWEYHDFKIEVCDGTYKIRRDWTIVDWCIGDGFVLSQIIKVADTQGPAMTCPANTTVSVDPFKCCGTIDLPNLVIEDECSRINNISGMVTTFDPFTNEQTGMYIIGGSLQDFPGNNWWDHDTLAAFGNTPCLPVGAQTVTYVAMDDCGNSTTCTFRLTIRDYVPPVAACDQTTTVSIGTDDPFDCYGPAGPNGQPAGLDACSFGGVTWVKASTFDDGSYDNCNQVKLTIRRMAPYSDCIENLNAQRGTIPCDAPNQSFPTERDRAISEQDSLKFYCCEVGTIQTIILSAYQLDINGGIAVGPDGSLIKNECMIQVEVQEKLKPVCIPPAPVTVNCENFDPSLWAYGKAEVSDNCCLDETKVYQDQCGLTHAVNYSLFDTVCNKGTITRTFRAFDCHGQSSQCTQRVVVTYEQDYYLRFPNDVIVTVCDDYARYDEPKSFGEDCELLGINYEDEIFTVVPDACFKIERTWTIINWCTYNPNAGCIYVPNPNPHPNTNNITNLPGPTVSKCGTLPPWTSTVVKINPGDPQATNFCSFWDKNANCYKYKQIIKVIDGQAPKFEHCPSDTVYCDLTTNHAGLWNDMDWWENSMQSHDLCEGPADLKVAGRDACSGTNVAANYLLFLDLDNDGTMESVINSLNPPPPGIVYFGNANNPNFGGGTPRTFDNRGLPTNQTYQFALLQNLNAGATQKGFSVRWNTPQAPNAYTIPEFPYGTHKIKWILQDGCGNQSVCEYQFTVKDCKAPTVVCLNGLSVNIMPTGMIQLWASDFLQYAEDNCTPAGQLKLGIRKCGTGTGFPLNPDGSPQTSVTFTCTETGTQCVEIWAIDAAGNADYCETYVIVQDNLGNCSNGKINVAGKVTTEMTEGVEETMVKVNGTSTFAPPYSFFDLSNNLGEYYVMNNVPLDASFTIAPEKKDNPLNGVTTYDLVLISKHILGTEPLDSPFKIIAGDANKSNSVTTFDIIELRKLILGIYTELPDNDSWRFVDYNFTFPNPDNPFGTVFPESISVANAMTNQMHGDFMGVKIGDLNYSAVANATMQAEARTEGTAIFDVADRKVEAGEVFEVTFKSAQALKGFQFTATLNGLTAISTVDAENVTPGNFNLAPSNAMTVSINGAQGFTVRFRAEKAGRLSEMLGVSGSITRAEAYAMTNDAMTRQDIAFRFDGKTISGLGFELYQNQPNPFMNRTIVGFFLPEAAEATLTVFDETGRLVYQQKGQFAKGENSIMLERALIHTTGVLYYKLETATDTATRKMIQAN